MARRKSRSPQVAVEQSALQSATTPGKWLVTWRIWNRSRSQLGLLGGHLPHSQFHGEKRGFSPALEVLPNRATELTFEVFCSEKPETVVENAFLILRVQYQRATWRIFARFRVNVDSSGRPHTRTESVTIHEASKNPD